ncbi:MAG: hypothetical protein II861_02720, partial [Methanomicrobium sp.]|nr:hypothetical protein [Methanomicrobium sp.]
ERRNIMYKFGTVNELNAVNIVVPEKVYQEVMSIAKMLDERFGAERDVEDDEGGFIFIALNNSDLSYFKKTYVELNSELLEYVLPVDDYFNAFYLYGYDYGISLFLPKSIAPDFMKTQSVNDAKILGA